MIKSLCENFKYILIIIVFVIMIISKLGAKIGYLSIKDVLINYFNCFRKKESKKLMILPILNYTVAPLLLGISAAQFKAINSEIINIIIIVISIIEAMLFTMVTMVIDMRAKIKSNTKYYRLEYEIAKTAIIETYYILMYEILVNIVILVLGLFCVYTEAYNVALSSLVYGLSFLMIYNLFMIIKRIFRLIDTDMNK